MTADKERIKESMTSRFWRTSKTVKRTAKNDEKVAIFTLSLVAVREHH